MLIPLATFFFSPPTYNHWVLQGLNISAFRFCAKLQNTQIHLSLRLTVFSRIVAKGPWRFCATVAKDSLLLQDRDRGRSRRARRLMQRRGWKGDVEGGREAEKSVKKIFITCLHEGISYSRHRGLKQQHSFQSSFVSGWKTLNLKLMLPSEKYQCPLTDLATSCHL